MNIKMVVFERVVRTTREVELEAMTQDCVEALKKDGYEAILVKDEKGEEIAIAGLCEECNKVLLGNWPGPNDWDEDIENNIKICHKCLRKENK